MPKSVAKIALSRSRDIPFNRLVLSQANVRRIKAGISIEELAEDIAHRTLLQSIIVRPILDDKGAETGMFEVPAGGRRFRALELLVKQKRLARNAPIPCVVRTEGLAEEDSLAENLQRAPLHPLDQFRAFLTLREKGRSEEEIAAAFFVSVAVVRQRLRLAAVSPKLLDVYAEDGMTLDQLMGFTVNPDHARQEQVWEALQRSYTKEPHQIRRMLTEGAVRASDKRAQFVGVEAYEDAGGVILRDLFNADDGGWLQDPALLDRLVTEKLDREADTIRAEGWKWVEVSPDFPYGHTYDLRRLIGEQRPLTEGEIAAHDALRAELDKLEKNHCQTEDIPEEVDRRLAEIETALAVFEERPPASSFCPLGVAKGLCWFEHHGRPDGEYRTKDVATKAVSAPRQICSAADWRNEQRRGRLILQVRRRQQANPQPTVSLCRDHRSGGHDYPFDRPSRNGARFRTFGREARDGRPPDRKRPGFAHGLRS